MKEVRKPWGRELWVAHNDRYAFKIIEMHTGYRSSLQYHEKKQETIYIDAGRARVTRGENKESLETVEMGPGSILDHPPGFLHRLEALEDLRLLEVSTPELDDVVRVEDDYKR